MINHIGTQHISTNRLTLRKFVINDYEDVFEKWTSLYESRYWQPPHKNIEQTKQLITEYIKRYENNNYYMWAIIFENELVGLICGNEINEEIKSICIGYCIAKNYWNNGIATEASKAIINYFFNIGFNRVFSYHNPLNPASGRIMQKCGMTLEGRIRGGSMFAGEICDCIQYSILKSDIVN